MADIESLKVGIDAVNTLPLEKLIWVLLAYQLWTSQRMNRAEFKASREEAKELREVIIQASSKTTLQNKQLMQIAADAVKAKSIDKLSFIRELLHEEDLYINRDIYEKRICSELVKQSNEYYLKLNQYILPKGDLLGDWADDNFKGYAEKFMETIFKVVFNKELMVEKKMAAIESIMMEVQNSLWDDLKIYLNKK